MSDITFDSKYPFENVESRVTAVGRLDNTHFVVAYEDYGDDTHGKAIIATVSDGTISYGSEYEFCDSEVAEIAILPLDSTHFVVAYQDYGNNYYGTARVGTVSDSTISYGDESVFNSSISAFHSFAFIDSTHFVIGYLNVSSQGGTKVGTVSDSTISYGLEALFDVNSVSYPSIESLDSTHFVVAWQDWTDNGHGYAKIGTISDSTITYGSAYEFNNDESDDIDVCSLDNTHFVVAFRHVDYDTNPGTAVIGTISDSTISFGSLYEFNEGGNTPRVALLETNRFVIVCYDATTIIATVSDSTISYGPPDTFNTNLAIYQDVALLNLNHIVITFADNANNLYGTGIIGTFTPFSSSSSSYSFSSSSFSSSSCSSSHSSSSCSSSFSSSSSSSSFSFSSSSSASPGSVCWGHDTGVTEVYIRDFAGTWAGTGIILGSGDSEAIGLDFAKEQESETWYVGSGTCCISNDKYAFGSGSGAIQYKTGTSRENCEADDWHNYVGQFASQGWVKIKISIS